MAMCHNLNYFTRRADMDFAIDEITWGFCGYRGVGAAEMQGAASTTNQRARAISQPWYLTVQVGILDSISTVTNVMFARKVSMQKV